MHEAKIKLSEVLTPKNHNSNKTLFNYLFELKYFKNRLVSTVFTTLKL